MSIKVRVHPFLRPFLQNMVEVEADGRTVRECILNLDRKFPGFRGQILNNKTQIREIFEIFINSCSAYPNELDKPVKDGDVVTIITYIAGG